MITKRMPLSPRRGGGTTIKPSPPSRLPPKPGAPVIGRVQPTFGGYGAGPGQMPTKAMQRKMARAPRGPQPKQPLIW